MFKKFQKQLKDYAIIKVSKDLDEKNNVIIRQLEPDDGGRVYNLRTCTFDQQEMLLVMVHMEDETDEGFILLTTYDEVAASVGARTTI